MENYNLELAKLLKKEISDLMENWKVLKKEVENVTKQQAKEINELSQSLQILNLHTIKKEIDEDEIKLFINHCDSFFDKLNSETKNLNGIYNLFREYDFCRNLENERDLDEYFFKKLIQKIFFDNEKNEKVYDFRFCEEKDFGDFEIEYKIKLYDMFFVMGKLNKNGEKEKLILESIDYDYVKNKIRKNILKYIGNNYRYKFDKYFSIINDAFISNQKNPGEYKKKEQKNINYFFNKE